MGHPDGGFPGLPGGPGGWHGSWGVGVGVERMGVGKVRRMRRGRVLRIERGDIMVVKFKYNNQDKRKSRIPLINMTERRSQLIIWKHSLKHTRS